MRTSSPITPTTIRPGGFSSPPPSPILPPSPTSIQNNLFGRFNPFAPRLSRLQRSEVPACGDAAFPPTQKPPSRCNQAKFLSPGLPKPANERLWKRGGGLRISSMPTPPSFPDPPSVPGMVGLGLIIPPPPATNHITSGHTPLPVPPAQQGDNIEIPHLEGSTQARVPTSPVLTSHSSHVEVSKETATTSCRTTLSALPHPSSPSTPHAAEAAIVGQAPKPPLSASSPVFKRSAALPLNATRLSRLVRRPRVGTADSTRLTPTSSVEGMSVASWLELDNHMSPPRDAVGSSPEPIEPIFSTTTDGDREDDLSQASFPADLTTEKECSSEARRRLFRHGAIVRFTQTLRRAKRAKESKKRGGPAPEDGDSDTERWSPQVSRFPHLAQILSTPRPPVVTFESKDATSPPVTPADHLDPDVRNVLSGLWSASPKDSPWVTSESTVGRRRPSSVVLDESTSPRDDSEMVTSDYDRAQTDEEDILHLYEDMSNSPSDSRSSWLCSSAASSGKGSRSSSESMG